MYMSDFKRGAFAISAVCFVLLFVLLSQSLASSPLCGHDPSPWASVLNNTSTRWPRLDDNPRPRTNISLVEFVLQRRQRNRPEARLPAWLKLNPRSVGIVVLDMWNQHWCPALNKRANNLAVRINELLLEFRKNGAHVLFMPTQGGVPFYLKTAMYDRVHSNTRVEVKYQRNYPSRDFVWNTDAILPAPLQWWKNEDSNCPDSGRLAPDFHLNRALDADEDCDGISESMEHSVSWFRKVGVTHVIFTGIHANMCWWGHCGAGRWQDARFSVIFPRDFVEVAGDFLLLNTTFEEQNANMVQYLEQYWFYSFDSAQVLASLKNLY